MTDWPGAGWTAVAGGRVLLVLVLDYAALRYDWNEFGIEMKGWYIRRDNLSRDGNGTGGVMKYHGQQANNRHDAICMGGGFVIREHVVSFCLFYLHLLCVHIMGGITSSHRIGGGGYLASFDMPGGRRLCEEHLVAVVSVYSSGEA
jgi:hypothetical protein